MTMQRSFKRLVRARMEKTGESYAAARASLLTVETPKANEGPALSLTDATIRERTGRGWEEWFDLLDEWGAADKPQEEASAWVSQEHGVDRWGSQAVTINYQRARGLRAVGEHANGFTVTASKTVAVPVERLYDAVVDDAQRERWLPGAALSERTATRPKVARFDWQDGPSRVAVFFAPKGEGRSLASVQHERLGDGEQAERMKSFWRERVSALKEVLEG
jgi:uncharacterized protein YndB with AHSA1/START domain